ncbi:MAG: hypothetical protein AAGM67_00285 [Bacteroidota bacterium]
MKDLSKILENSTVGVDQMSNVLRDILASELNHFHYPEGVVRETLQTCLEIIEPGQDEKEKLRQVSRRLSQILRTHDWFSCVGISDTKLYVYVKNERGARNFKHFYLEKDGTYEGIPVEMGTMGTPRPAIEGQG